MAGETKSPLGTELPSTGDDGSALPGDDTEPAPDGPLLDLSRIAVRQLITAAKRRGYVTHGQINAILSTGEVASDQIEDDIRVESLDQDIGPQGVEEGKGKHIPTGRVEES